jgi:4'-phosphopantetheinyl transferase
MNKDTLQLWLAYPDDVLDRGVAEACERLLSEEERARWEGFKFDRLRREYLATRALVRTALADNHPIAPEGWRFRSNEYGKPAAEPGVGIHFNLSNSRELVVCLIARGAEVGVDVEPFTRASGILEVAPRVFSELERRQLDGLGDRERLARGVSLWTLKEAYIKARGMGLSLPLDKISFVFGGAQEIRLELDRSLKDEPSRWRFCLLDHAGHRVALMVERTADAELEIWEARPLLAEPTRLADLSPRWLPHP